MKKHWLLAALLSVLPVFVSVFVVTAGGPIEGRAGRAEVRFLEGMMDHHQMAVDMANDCLSKATTEAVVTLCQNIIDAQTAEITTMHDWLLAWYNVDYTPMPMNEMMDMMGDGMSGMNHEGMPATDPMMMMGMMAGLNRFEGVEYEVAWLEAMVDHHDDALHMSERLLERVPEGEGHTELHEMAQQIIQDQTAEIETIEQMLTELSAQ
jgi:uncharacterized protein (DUF305 family)